MFGKKAEKKSLEWDEREDRTTLTEEEEKAEEEEIGWGFSATGNLYQKLCYSRQVLRGISTLSPLHDPSVATTCSYFGKTRTSLLLFLEESEILEMHGKYVFAIVKCVTVTSKGVSRKAVLSKTQIVHFNRYPFRGEGGRIV